MPIIYVKLMLIALAATASLESLSLQVLTKASLALAMLAFAGVLVIFLVLLIGRGAPVGYALVVSSVIFASTVSATVVFYAGTQPNSQCGQTDTCCQRRCL